MARILVLEDSAPLRRLVVHALTEAGHTVVQRENGLGAYDVDLLNSVDLMITDLVMPRVDGLDAIRTARSTRADLKIIAMSGGSASFSQDYLQVADIFGAESVLHKPFEPADLIGAVDTALAA